MKIFLVQEQPTWDIEYKWAVIPYPNIGLSPVLCKTHEEARKIYRAQYSLYQSYAEVKVVP